MISGNKIATWIDQNGSPPATLPAKELRERLQFIPSFVLWECTFRASDHCQQMRERETAIICNFTTTSFQRGLEIPANGPLQCTGPDVSGEGARGKRKRREKRDRGKWSRVMAKRQWRLRQPGDRKSAAGFFRRLHDSVSVIQPSASKWPCPGAKSNMET